MIRGRAAIALALLCACTPAPEVLVVATREIGPVADIADIDGVKTRTRGYSMFGFGRSVWLFGATQLTSPDSQGSSVRANSWSHTPDLAGRDGIALFATPTDEWGGPAELFPPTAEELAFNTAHAQGPSCEAPCGTQLRLSPLAAVRNNFNGQILLFYAKLSEAADGQRTSIGSSVAAWIDFDFGPVRPVLDAGSDEPTLLFHAHEPRFGQAAVVHDDALYAYGCSDDLYHPCMLARVKLEAVFERAAWQFWTGREWSTSLTDAGVVFELGERAEQAKPAPTALSVIHNGYVDRYLAVYGDAQSGEILLRSALTPEGPWSSATAIFATEPPIADAILHPEYRRGAGQFEYFTYRHEAELQLVELELAPSE